LWKYDQYAFVTTNLHSFPRTFAHIWSNWDSTFVMFSLNCDFNYNLSMKYNCSCFFFFLAWLLSFRISTLKSPIMMIGQCLGYCWIIVWRLFKNIKIEHEWILYTHIICIVFRVLILKIAIYFEPSLVIVLK